jgi:hypothetical protein
MDAVNARRMVFWNGEELVKFEPAMVHFNGYIGQRSGEGGKEEVMRRLGWWNVRDDGTCGELWPE